MAFLRGFSFLIFFCTYHFSYKPCVLSTHYIPDIVLGAEDWTLNKRTRFWRYLFVLSGAPVWGGNVRKGALPHICPLPAGASLHRHLCCSPFCLSCYSVPASRIWFWFTLSCLFASFCPHPLFSCQRALFLPLCPSLHGNIFPHLSHRVLNAMIFFLSPSFIRERKPFS